METEELTKLVDGIYKNILDKFNPGARQMITAGKAYLKALHGAAAASRLYVDAVGKLGRQAQQGTWGGCADIGTALMKVVEVYREIQDQQMNILKAFYVDLLVPLETNLEKDTKVVQSEQKRFLQQHKLRSESYSKAAATIKKQRKKKPNVTKVGSAMDKEMKNMQILEEEKTKLDAFCEQSLKNAMTQERRRYGFVLERQCSLAKHWLAYHTAGAAAYNSGLDEWLEVSRTREYLPPNVEAMFVSRMRQVSFWADEDVYASPRVGDDDDRASVGSALRKTRSVDASCLDVRSIGDLGSPAQGLSRAKSDFNLQASSNNEDQVTDTRTATRPSSLAPPTCTSRDPPLARALYAYAAAGDNQLSFSQGDVLALLGERTKGWQYGENLRTHHAGWFPLAYTEPIPNDETGSPARWSVQTPSEAPPPAPMAHAQTTPSAAVHSHSHPPARMFGDTVTAHHVTKGRLGSGSPGLPPTLPAPSPSALSTSASATFHASTPAATAPGAIKNSTSSASFTTHAVIETRSFGPQTLPMRSQVAQNKAGPAKTVVSAVGAVGNVSLHSSNDSGFSNEPPPQPDVDYSDEEAQRLRVPISKSAQQNNDNRAYLLKTQSLKRGPNPNNTANGYLTDDQQLMLRNMLDMDKDSQKVKRTKSFWKFGRTTAEEIMEGMSLWQHRDIVDTVPEYKKKFFEKMKKELRPAPDIPKQVSPDKVSVVPTENGQPHRPKETIDRKEMKIPNGIRQAKSLGSIQNEERNEKSRKMMEGYHQSQTMNKKSMSEKSIIEEKHEDFIPRNESRHSDLTNTSTIKTNFENSFYNDENGEGFVMKTVKRREILQKYDNDSSSDVNSVASSTDPYDCIIVDDHMKSRKQQEMDRRRQTQMVEDVKKRKENAYMPEFEEIEVTPIKPHVRATLSSEKPKNPSHERSPPKTMEFKTFKDNSKEIKTFSASSETLKYKENEQHTDRYGIPMERTNNENRNEDIYNGHDEGTLKYKKRSSSDEKNHPPNNFENGKNHKKEYPQAEMRHQKKESRPYEPNREPRIDYSLDRRQTRKEFTDTKGRDPKKNRANRSYDDSSLPYNGRREERYYESNISYFSDQERRSSRYDYETDSKKAEKSKIRQEEARLEARRFVDRRSEGPYSESDDQKFNEALKQQRPQLLPRTKLLKRPSEGNELLPEEGHTFGPWYDLWGRETAVYK